MAFIASDGRIDPFMHLGPDGQAGWSPDGTPWTSGSKDDWFAQFDPSQASPNTGVNGGVNGSSPPPGNPQLPGYGDWTTSNPWRDSLSYQETMAGNGVTQGAFLGMNAGNPAQDAANQVATTAARSSPQAGANGPEAFGQAWLASGGRTVADLQAFVKAHPEFGATLFGSKGDKIQFANGDSYDGVLSAGAGGLGATFNKLGGAGGGQGSALAGLGYGFGDAMKPYGGQYALPTLDQFKASPMYGAGLDAFNRANQNSAAAKGTLLNGRTNEAMNQSAEQYGMTQYGALAGLNKGVFDTNYDVWKDNRDSPFNKNLSLAQLGKPT